MSDKPIVPNPDHFSKDMIDAVAREIAANVADKIDQFYPGALSERGLHNVKCWTRNEVTRWFGKPDPSIKFTTLDQRLRASAAHRRHLKRLRTITGQVNEGAQIEPILEAFDDSSRQALLDYRAGGPVIEPEH